MLKQRSHHPELIDLGLYNNAEYEDCLYQLDRIGRYLGGDRATFQAFKKLKTIPKSILDVGCGGGLFTMRLAERHSQASVVGIDLSQDAISFANRNLNKCQNLKNVKFYVPATPQLDLNQQFDVVTSTLVCHHLSDDDLISFLKSSCAIAKQVVVINDLHRHPLAWIAFSIIAPIFFRNRLIFHDGLLSIRRSFKRQDWWYYLNKAGINKNDCTVTWHWPFRWIVFINTAKKK